MRSDCLTNERLAVYALAIVALAFALYTAYDAGWSHGWAERHRIAVDEMMRRAK